MLYRKYKGGVMEQKLLEYFHGDELACQVWLDKYAAESEHTPDDTHRRLAKEFARIEDKYKQVAEGKNPDLSDHYYKQMLLDEDTIYGLFKNFRYIIPGGSVMAGCGLNKPVSLSNCFVLASPEDSYAGIMDTRCQQVQLMKRRGGVGYDISSLRPRGAEVSNSAGTSTGAASFMEVCSAITNEVAQNGRRKMFLN